MNIGRNNYYSEETALKHDFTLKIRKSGDDLLNYYLDHGFNKLSESLGLKFEWQIEALFDFLVFEKEAISSCIETNKKYFLKLIAEGSGDLIRDILGITDVKYKKVWKSALAILHDAFLEKIHEERKVESVFEIYFKKVLSDLDRKSRESLN